MGDPAVNRKMLLDMMRDGLTTRDEKPWSDDPKNALVEYLKAGGTVDEVPQELVNTFTSSYDIQPPRPRYETGYRMGDTSGKNDDYKASNANRGVKEEYLERGWDDLKRKELRKYADQLMRQQTEQSTPPAQMDVQNVGSIPPPRPAPSTRRSAFSLVRDI